MRSLLITASFLALASVAVQAQTAAPPANDAFYTSDPTTRWAKEATPDVEDEINGLLTYDRAVPKASPEALSEIAGPLWKVDMPD